MGGPRNDRPQEVHRLAGDVLHADRLGLQELQGGLDLLPGLIDHLQLRTENEGRRPVKVLQSEPKEEEQQTGDNGLP